MAGQGGQSHSVAPVIVFLKEGHEFRWKISRYAGLFRAEHGFRVVPEDVGRCRFEQFEVFRGPLAGAFLAKQGKALETGFQAMNRMLKREAEKRGRERA
jgi:hypothetical protein